MDEDGKIVEVLCFGEYVWGKTTLRDWNFALKGVMNYPSERMRLIEVSLDNGVTWKERYDLELVLLGKDVVMLMQWRVKK